MSAPSTPRRALRLVETPPQHQRGAADALRDLEREAHDDFHRATMKTAQLSLARCGVMALAAGVVLDFLQEPPPEQPAVPPMPVFHLQPARLILNAPLLREEPAPMQLVFERADAPPQLDLADEPDWEAMLHFLERAEPPAAAQQPR